MAKLIAKIAGRRPDIERMAIVELMRLEPLKSPMFLFFIAPFAPGLKAHPGLITNMLMPECGTVLPQRSFRMKRISHEAKHKLTRPLVPRDIDICIMQSGLSVQTISLTEDLMQTGAGGLRRVNVDEVILNDNQSFGSR